MSNFAKVFFVECMLAMPMIVSASITKPPLVMHIAKGSTNGDSSTIFDTTLHILNITNYLEKGNRFPTIWQIGSEPHNFQKELGVDTDHFATFPQALCEIPVKFGCPENGIVLDPFAGSGTTLLVAKKLNRNYIGIEINPSYIKIANKRLTEIQSTLFSLIENKKDGINPVVKIK